MEQPHSFKEIVSKQLKSWPKTKAMARMGYWEALPAKQIQADTMFWKVTRGKGEVDIPILVIVDVATRFTGYFLQTRKNDSVAEHVREFLRRLRAQFPEGSSAKTLLVTDGAKELAVKGVRHKVSRGLNKAVLAEVKIRQARQILREIELEIDLENLEKGTEVRIDRKNLGKFLKEIEAQVNAKAKLREAKEVPPPGGSPFSMGDAVLALNLHKFFPFQIGEALRKTSYDRPWYTEPFYVSKVFSFQGVYKYSLRSFVDDSEIRYSFYPDQLQKLDSRIAYDYVKAYVDYVKGRQGTDFFENSK